MKIEDFLAALVAMLLTLYIGSVMMGTPSNRNQSYEYMRE